jgi:hypothetical protein
MSPNSHHPLETAGLMEPEKLSVNIREGEAVTALLYCAVAKRRAGITLILGHGAGGNQLSGFMRQFASGLTDRGIDILTFNFLYSEKGRGAPDHRTKLEACYRAVIATALAHKKLKNNRLFIGGKSMGGRIASQVAAEAVEGLSGLVFLGYPLHPPGNPEKLRDQHLKDIKVPMLFIQGARDAFGTQEEIADVIKRLQLKATLHAVAGGDHSLKAPKSAGMSQDEIYSVVMDRVSNWMSEGLASKV